MFAVAGDDKAVVGWDERDEVGETDFGGVLGGGGVVDGGG